MSAAKLYLDLLKNCITNYAFIDDEPPIHGYTKDQIRELRKTGGDWPLASRAVTMIGLQRLENLQKCVETVLQENIPGDLIETGIWRGGACIFMRGILAAYEDQTRNVYCADCFDGVPPPDPKYPADDGNILHTARDLAVSVEQVFDNFRRYGLLDKRVRLIPGLFKDTLHLISTEKFAVLRLDGDLYGSTWEALEALYPKLSPGGFCIIDDYALPPCRKAVEDYRVKFGITEPIALIDKMGAFWRRRPPPPEDKIFDYGTVKFYDFAKASSPDWIARDVIDQDVYGIKNIEFKPGDVVIDIGANIGIFAIHLAKLHPEVRVIAFEPSEVNFGHLLKNIGLNEVKNVEPYKLALTDDGRKIQVGLDEGNTGGASIYGPERRMTQHTNWCDSVKLDNFLAQNFIIRVKFIKCDVEGSEYEIFKSLKHFSEYLSVEIHSPRGHNDTSDSVEKLSALIKAKVETNKLILMLA